MRFWYALRFCFKQSDFLTVNSYNLNNADSRPRSIPYVRELMHGHARDGGSEDCEMQEVYPHESRCLRRHQYRLISIPSPLSCVLGSGSDTIHQAQHFSPLTRPSSFSTPYYVVDKQNSVRTFIQKRHFVLEFSLNSLILFYCYTLNNAVLYTVANPARGLLNRKREPKKKSGSIPPPPTPHTARSEKINKIYVDMHGTEGRGIAKCRKSIHMSMCVCFLPIHSGHQVLWTYQPGSHRRKVTQGFSSTFFLRCVP